MIFPMWKYSRVRVLCKCALNQILAPPLLVTSLSRVICSPVTMRAILIKDEKGPVENLYLGEAPLPVLRAGHVLVKVSSTH
jgi:hypothetical protein